MRSEPGEDVAHWSQRWALEYGPVLMAVVGPLEDAGEDMSSVRLRIRLALGLFLVLLSAIGYRVLQLQLIRGDKYFKQAAADGILFENIQTTCPVSGHELKDKSVFTDFEGRRIAFCSEKCQSAFNENPAKHLKKLDMTTDSGSNDMKMDMEKAGQSKHSGHNQ